MKKIFIFLGHPDNDSFNASMAETYRRGAEAAGAEVRLTRLGDLTFDPVLWKGYRVIQDLEPDLKTFQQNLAWCDHAVFAFPTWWGSVPALLKGLLDRAILPGFAFHYTDDSPFPKKLLTGRSAHLLVTMDAPTWYYRWFIGAPGHAMMKRAVLTFCGFKPVRITDFGHMKDSNPKQRERFLRRVEALGRRWH